MIRLMPIDLRFRATQDYATRNGFVGGIPTFYVADLPSNIVYGALLIRSEATDWRDIPVSALGGPPLPSDFVTRIRAVNAYAKRWGYASGFPTFLQSVADNDYVYGAMLFKQGFVQIAQPTADLLGNQIELTLPWFQAVQQFAANNKDPGGYPTFETVVRRIVLPGRGTALTQEVYPTVLLTETAAEWRDVPASALDSPNLADPAQHVASMQRYAASQGFVGAIPTFFLAELGGFRCGTLLLNSTGAEWRDVEIADLQNVDPSDAPGRFRAVQDYARVNQFVGGYPNFYIGEQTAWTVLGPITATVDGTVLLNNTVADWRDVPASDLGNPDVNDLPGRFRATQDYAAKTHATGGFPNFYQADPSPAPGNPAPQRVYGTILLSGSGVEFRDVFYQDLFTEDYIKGAIRDHWELLGGPISFLGLPTTEELTCADGTGKFNQFDGGVVYFSPSTGAFEVHGAILDRWSALGFETSYLGYPISDEHDWTDRVSGRTGRVSQFQNGSIVFIDGNIIEMPDTITHIKSVTTPDGTALGGSVTFTLQSNGNFNVQFRMHDSGAFGYDFAIRALFAAFDPQNVGPAQGGVHLLAAHSGHVGGTASSGQRDDIHTDAGFAVAIQQHWPIIRKGTLFVSKDYSATGVLGVFEDILGSIFSVVENAVGITTGIVLALGNEAGQLLDNLGVGAPFALIGGVIVFAFAGGFALAVVSGVVVGEVIGSQLQSRPITQGEYDFANNNVFGGTLPPMDQLILTNFGTPDNRPFTMPGIDGKIYVNMADLFSADTTAAIRGTTYPTKGEVLIYELTHAWQIFHHASFPWSPVVCQEIVNGINYALGQNPYQYGPPGAPWGEMN